MTEKRESIDREDHITDEGGAWKYFAPMLHMDDDDLDPYEYRLLGHYRRVCGENGGKCTQSTRTIAGITRMSTGKVSNARKRLAALGRIRIVYTKKTCEITLKDCWAENIQRYTKRSPDEHVHIVNTISCSPDEHVHSVNGKRSPGETKNKPYKKEPEREDARDSKGSLLLQAVASLAFKIEDTSGLDRKTEQRICDLANAAREMFYNQFKSRDEEKIINAVTAFYRDCSVKGWYPVSKVETFNLRFTAFLQEAGRKRRKVIPMQATEPETPKMSEEERKASLKWMAEEGRARLRGERKIVNE